MKAQVFTLDMLLGTFIIISILSAGFSIYYYFFKADSLTLSSSNVISLTSSAVSSFSILNSTALKLAGFQNGTLSNNAFTQYISSTLGEEITMPISVEVFVRENYGSGGLPLISVFNYSSPAFDSLHGSVAFTQPLIAANLSKACGSLCNLSLTNNSVFPLESAIVNAQNCTVFRAGSAINLVGKGWTITNNSPAGSCNITLPSYANALPGAYIVKAYTKSGTSLKQTTLHVLSFDVVVVSVQT